MQRKIVLLATALVFATRHHAAHARVPSDAPGDSAATSPPRGGVASPPHSGKARPLRGVVAFHPLSLFAGMVGVEAGVRVSERLSLAAGARYTLYDSRRVQGRLWGGSLGLHYFFLEALQGYYIYPRLVLEHAELSAGADHVSGYLLTRAATAGHQWVMGPVSVKLGLGGRHTYASLSSEITGAVGVASGFAPLVDMDLGVAF